MPLADNFPLRLGFLGRPRSVSINTPSALWISRPKNGSSIPMVGGGSYKDTVADASRYEIYYETILAGRFAKQIDKLHEKYGQSDQVLISPTILIRTQDPLFG